MRIAIASGKGGTGKTTLSVAFAQAADPPVQYLDCDVEEPNGHVFLRLKVESEQDFPVLIPEINQDRCKGCGECADICEFNAITTAGGKALVFPDLCHSCGGCVKICPERAITERERPIGKILKGTSGDIEFVHGSLNVKEIMAPPLIRGVKRYIDNSKLTLIDSPPGTSCPMIEAVKGADYVLLVTEPTPFGLNDLEIAVETVQGLKIPFGVAINRSDAGDNRVEKFCRDKGIPVVLRIPDRRIIAEGYSKGETILDILPEIKKSIRNAIKIAERNHYKGVT